MNREVSARACSRATIEATELNVLARFAFILTDAAMALACARYPTNLFLPHLGRLFD